MGRLLLHACCGPCLIEPLDALRTSHDVTVAFANPNIQPAAELARRREALLAYAVSQGTPVVELASAPPAWARAAAPFALDRHERCRQCFRLRLGAVAAHAATHGFGVFATTLTVSPYQDVVALREAAEEAAETFGVAYLHTDFRPAYQDAVRRSRELGMYRQNYCGCLLSRVEAERERSARKAARKAEREAAPQSRDAERDHARGGPARETA